MKPAAFDYHRPATLAEAIDLMERFGDSAAAISGGQSLVPLMNLRLSPSDQLVDLSRLAELQQTRDLGDSVFLGAGLTHAMFEDGAAPDPANGLMRQAASHIAYRAVRCHGTIGGSVAMADPAADWPAVLLALDAAALVRGPMGERRIAMDALLTGTYTTSLETGEIITGFEVPKLPADARTSYVKFNRKVGAFASSLAVAVRQGEALRLVLAGAGPRATLLAATAAAFIAGAPKTSVRNALAGEVVLIVEADDPYACALHIATILRAIEEIS